MALMRNRVYKNPCTFEGPDGARCSNKARARGLCTSHLDQLARGRELSPLLGPHGRKYDGCTFPGCDKPHAGNGLCTGHRAQLHRGQEVKPLGDPWRLPRSPKGRWVDPKGYVWIRCPEVGHPNAKRGGWIAEHVWIMSEMLGRPLRPGETVHHRNLTKDDNAPRNLEPWTSHQPRAARVADMLAWCRWFIGQYSDAPEWTAVPGGPLTERGAEAARGSPPGSGYQPGSVPIGGPD